MKRKNLKILLITSLISSLFLIVISFLFYLLKLNTIFIIYGTITGVVLGWMYALISIYSAKLVFQTENLFMQLGFSVLKIGILFFALYLFYIFIIDKAFIYGTFIGISFIFIYHISSSIIFVKERS